MDSIASPVWIKRVAASGGLLFRGRHSLVSPSLLYILGVRWNKARGQSSTRQGAFDKKGARSLLQIRFHFFVTVLHDASCFCRFSASFLSIWLQSSIPRSSCECLLPLDNHDVSCQAVLCSWHTVLIPFCHAGPFIKFDNSQKLFVHTKTTWLTWLFFVSRFCHAGMKWENPRCEWIVTSFLRSASSIRAVSSRSSVQYITKSRWKLCWVAQRSFFILENLEWQQRPIRERSTIKKLGKHLYTMQFCTCHWCHYSTPLLNSVRGPLSACLKITDPPCQHGLDIFGFDETPLEFPRFVSWFRCQDECLLQGWGPPSINPSIIPQPSRPSSPGKMSPGGCDHGGACSTGNLCLCHLCPRWCQRSLWTLWCRSHITSYLERRRCCFGWVGVWIFASHGFWFTATNFSGSWKIDLSLFSGWKYVKHHL